MIAILSFDCEFFVIYIIIFINNIASDRCFRFQTFQVRVVAKNGDGFEAASVWLEFRTPGTNPSNFRLATSGWFYGIFICLLLIILGLIALMLAKRQTDRSWEENERLISEQVGAARNKSYITVWLLNGVSMMHLGMVVKVRRIRQ